MKLRTKDILAVPKTILSIPKTLTRFTKKTKEDIGIPPDELIFRGEKKTEEVHLRIINYNSTDLQESTVAQVSEALSYPSDSTVTWFNIDGLHDPAIMNSIAKGVQIDKMVMASVMDTSARPHINDYDDCIFISVKMLQQNDETGALTVDTLSLVLVNNILLTFQERKGDVFAPIRTRIRSSKKRIRTSRADYLLFAILDIVIDNYIYIISLLGDKIEDLENAVLDNPKQDVIEEINNLKRELNYLRKNIGPAKEVILSLSKIESNLIDDANEVHFKELVDNINEATDATDSYREILSDQLNIYHTTISSKLNDTMKFLTVFSVIFIPLTFIAGIYGTNFEYVPELHYKYSYFIMWGVMVVVALGMLLYFKNKKWL